MSTSFESLIVLDIAANRPVAAKPGRIFFDTTNKKIQRDNGSTWDDVPIGISDIFGALAFSGDISPSQVTSDQNDYNPTGLSTATVLRLSTNASRNVTGLQGGSDGRIIVIVNVGSNDLVLKDSDTGSSAANRFALSADITLGADDGVILQYDTTSSRWRCIGKSPGATGGGAPSTAKYLTTASDGSLSAEVVIPGLAGSADIAGVAGSSFAYEFDSGASPLTWSAAVDVENVNSTVLSHLYIQDNGATETLGTFAWAPAGAFDIRCKISLGAEIGASASTCGVALLVGDSSMSNRGYIRFAYNGSSHGFQIDAYTYASSTQTQRGATNSFGSNVVYLRVTRDGSNNLSFYYSSDGNTWILVATQALTFTMAKGGLRLTPNSVITTVVSDWIRGG